MNWYRIIFEKALTHAVPANLKDQLIAELTERHHPPVEEFSLGGPIAEITEWGFDLGGMAIMGEPQEEFTAAGLLWEVSSDHVSGVLSSFKKLPLRYFADGSPYYKAKFWLHATVMNPDQYHEILGALEACADVAEERAEAFFKARREKRLAAGGKV